MRAIEEGIDGISLGMMAGGETFGLAPPDDPDAPAVLYQRHPAYDPSIILRIFRLQDRQTFEKTVSDLGDPLVSGIAAATVVDNWVSVDPAALNVTNLSRLIREHDYRGEPHSDLQQ